ncbi:hypothetical protein, partial [Pseudonocardia sp. ICBG601]|uniref:hypothetical protein n=1 Tax=Pseudonocardia sp. ICBG601 TaxID=2846759 RepID=UPI001CF637C2
MTGLPPSTDSAASVCGSRPATAATARSTASASCLGDRALLGGDGRQRQLDLQQGGDPRAVVEQAVDPVGTGQGPEQRVRHAYERTACDR